jgi:outer membrane protein assembly factor BamA
MHAQWLPRAGACMAALVALLAAPAQAQQSPADTIEVLSVSFEGERAVPESVLRVSIRTGETQCISAALKPLCWFGLSEDKRYLDERALAADVFLLRLGVYYPRGFREAKVELDTARVPGGVHVTFRIEEGRPLLVRGITLEGAEEMPADVTRRLPLQTGRPFSMVDFEATRDSLVWRMSNLGHAAADVLANYEISADDPYTADVAFTLIPGEHARFGRIDIAGNNAVSADVVRNMLLFREGDPYSRQALLGSQRNLFTIDVFRHAEIITPIVSDTDTVVPVTVRVTEGDLHRIRFGAGASTAEYVNVEGRWVARNLFGSARRLEVRGRVTNIAAEPLSQVPVFEGCSDIYCDLAGSIGVDYTRPWLFDPHNTGNAGVFAERFTLPGVYVRTSLGGYLSLRRALPPGGAVTFGYRPELTRLESDGDLIFCVNFAACEERAIDVLREREWLSPLAGSVVLDRSNSLLAPSAGWIVRADAEYASSFTASDYDYLRVFAEGSMYHDPLRGVVFASRLRAGWARALDAPGSGIGLHPQKRFFAGGPNSVRGFAQYRLGPRLLTVNAAERLALPVTEGGAGCTAQQINAGLCDLSPMIDGARDEIDERPVGGAFVIEGNVELRFPIRSDLRGATFVDFGQVWASSREAAFGELRWTPGAGVRYFSPIGPIRVDVAYNPGAPERLTVVTTEVCDDRTPADGCDDIVPGAEYDHASLANRRRLIAQPGVLWPRYGSFMDRLQFHFSIGQAF